MIGLGVVTSWRWRGKSIGRISRSQWTGAADTVAPKSVGRQFPVNLTIASIYGMTYSAANGTEIKNEGERKITGKTSDCSPVTITKQVVECLDQKLRR